MIPLSALDLAVAWLCDLLFGDPPHLRRFHPIVWVGNGVARLEAVLYRPASSASGLFVRGMFLWLAVVGGALAFSLSLLTLSGWVHPLLGNLCAIFIGWACLSTRDLDRQVRRVATLVESGQLEEAREKLGYIVGRDTHELPAPEILRAAFETAAENSSDGIVAPLFYLALGNLLGLGPALGFAYKAVNTLDSMVGYRNERYLFFGRFSARADDLFNWLPARLTGWLAVAGSALLLGTGERARQVMLRDASLHSSPNAGYPEAAFAGGVGVKLGGVNFYKGVARNAPEIGLEGAPPLRPAHVDKALALTWFVSAAALAGGLLMLALFLFFSTP